MRVRRSTSTDLRAAASGALAVLATASCALALCLAGPAPAGAASRLRVAPLVREQEPLASVQVRARLTDARGRGVPAARCVFTWLQGRVVLHRDAARSSSSGRVTSRWAAAQAAPGEVVRVSVRCRFRGRLFRAATSFVPQPPLPSSPKMVFIGDSLTRGLYAQSDAHSFRSLSTAALPCTAEVLLSSDGRSDGVDLAQVTAAEGDIYVIELGTNDASGAPTGVPATPLAVERNLASIVQAARNGNPSCRVVFLTLWQFRFRREAYDARIVSLSRSVGKHVVDIAPVKDDPGCRGPKGVETPWGLSDAWHPNDTGHAAIAQRLVSVVRRLLRLSGVPVD